MGCRLPDDLLGWSFAQEITSDIPSIEGFGAWGRLELAKLRDPDHGDYDSIEDEVLTMLLLGSSCLKYNLTGNRVPCRAPWKDF